MIIISHNLTTTPRKGEEVMGELTARSRNSMVALVAKLGGMGLKLHSKHPTSKVEPNSHSIHHPNCVEWF